jgi:hypothetical protein
MGCNPYKKHIKRIEITTHAHMIQTNNHKTATMCIAPSDTGQCSEKINLKINGKRKINCLKSCLSNMSTGNLL